MRMPITADQLTAFPLSTGEVFRVPTSIQQLSAWRGESPGATYGGKQVLDWRGRPAFAELAILWELESDGWTGAWVDSYRRRFLRGYWDPEAVTIPDEHHWLLKRIHGKTGFPSGCWDVFCWRGDDVLFVESKRKGRDRIRQTQRNWLEAALNAGVPLESFLLVEWTLDAEPF